MQSEPLILDKREKRKLAGEFPDLCLTCGTCAGGCPVTGVDGMDMRKAVRMALLGLDQELIDSRFPWICTLCARCEHGCPMSIDLLKMMRSARAHREREIDNPLRGAQRDLVDGKQYLHRGGSGRVQPAADQPVPSAG